MSKKTVTISSLLEAQMKKWFSERHIMGFEATKPLPDCVPQAKQAIKKALDHPDLKLGTCSQAVRHQIYLLLKAAIAETAANEPPLELEDADDIGILIAILASHLVRM